MVLIGNVDANINTVDIETSINMVDDDRTTWLWP